MKAKVKLTYSVELFVEADSEEAIYDWMNQTTPEEAAKQVKDNNRHISEDYSEEVICFVRDDSDTDLKI